jgi:hypothetical protein
MASWLVKALVQRGIGALPNPHYWNELFQDRVTHSLDLTKERFEVSLGNCRNHLEQLQRYGSTATSGSFSAFELGTGWFPDGPDWPLPLWRSRGLDLGYRATPEARPVETHDSAVPRA